MRLGYWVESWPTGALEDSHCRLAIRKHHALVDRSIGSYKCLSREDEACEFRFKGCVPGIYSCHCRVMLHTTYLTESDYAIPRAVRDRREGRQIRN